MKDDLWTWAVAAYGAPGVAEACLDLQDTAGQNVPLLLWAAWSASSGRALDADTLEAACDTARVWDEAAVTPLRTLRRALKVSRLDMADADREAVRAQIKANELDAERRLMAALAELSPAPEGAARPTFDALIAVARAWDRGVPREGLRLLSTRLPA